MSPGFCTEDHGNDAAALLAHHGIERAHVVGHSYGARIALALVFAHPALAHTLALLEPGLPTRAAVEAVPAR